MLCVYGMVSMSAFKVTFSLAINESIKAIKQFWSDAMIIFLFDICSWNREAFGRKYLKDALCVVHGK